MGDLAWPAKAWGVEHLTTAERVARAFDAGVDQLGGEAATDLILELVEQGVLSESRIDESVRRILAVKFDLGLFDQPYVDEVAAEQIVAAPEFVAEGHRAQARSITVLKNDDVLPLRPGTKAVPRRAR